MKKTARILAIFLLCLLLAACGREEVAAVSETTVPTTPTTEQTTVPTTVPSTTEPEPVEEHFTLTFVGDCTLGSDPGFSGALGSFLNLVGEDYRYPFRNVIDYFENDDLTVINLEGTFCPEGIYPAGAIFSFRGPPEYVNILTENSIEMASFANNHAMDYRQEGYDSTLQVLGDAGVGYVEEDSSSLVVTESGLTVGFYAIRYEIDYEDMAAEIAALKEQGAEVIVASMHWGVEGSYRPRDTQTNGAHAAIDAGAHIVYGHHPHVLQPMESYNGGIIFYSLGNFCFGGNHYPADMDTVIMQQEIIRVDGQITMGELTVIPASCSSVPIQNNFQPTPYAEGTEEYERVMTKLRGEWKGGDLKVGY